MTRGVQWTSFNLWINGILLGIIYAAVGVGLSMIFGIMRLVNLAHGDLMILASYLTLVLVASLGISPTWPW